MVEDMGSNLQKVGFFSVIDNRISNTSYHLQYLYCQGGYVFGAKANLITFVAEFFLSVGGSWHITTLGRSCTRPWRNEAGKRPSAIMALKAARREGPTLGNVAL